MENVFVGKLANSSIVAGWAGQALILLHLLAEEPHLNCSSREPSTIYFAKSFSSASLVCLLKVIVNLTSSRAAGTKKVCYFAARGQSSSWL